MELARIKALVVIVVTSLAVLTPLVPDWRGRNNDSFPLSWYPMFAKERPLLEKPTYVIATGPDGQRQKIDVRWWTHGGFNQGRNMLTELVKGGADKLTPFCERIAKKVADRKEPEWQGIDEVKVVVGQYDRRKFFQAGDRKPVSEKLIFRCGVPR